VRREGHAAMRIPFLIRHVTTLLILITGVSIRGHMSNPQITQPGGPAVMHDTDTYRIKSRRVGAEFEIRVARPLPPFTGGAPSNYDVLYVLDGDFFFGVATDMTRLMHRLFGNCRRYSWLASATVRWMAAPSMIGAIAISPLPPTRTRHSRAGHLTFSTFFATSSSP
jgi:hypothetical protein